MRRIAKELAPELGLGDYFPFTSFEEYLSTRLQGAKITLEELKKTGIHFLPRQTPLYLKAAEDFRWHTLSGKIELYSAPLAGLGRLTISANH